MGRHECSEVPCERLIIARPTENPCQSPPLHPAQPAAHTHAHEHAPGQQRTRAVLQPLHGRQRHRRPQYQRRGLQPRLRSLDLGQTLRVGPGLGAISPLLLLLLLLLMMMMMMLLLLLLFSRTCHSRLRHLSGELRLRLQVHDGNCLPTTWRQHPLRPSTGGVGSMHCLRRRRCRPRQCLQRRAAGAVVPCRRRRRRTAHAQHPPPAAAGSEAATSASASAAAAGGGPQERGRIRGGPRTCPQGVGAAAAAQVAGRRRGG